MGHIHRKVFHIFTYLHFVHASRSKKILPRVLDEINDMSMCLCHQKQDNHIFVTLVYVNKEGAHFWNY